MLKKVTLLALLLLFFSACAQTWGKFYEPESGATCSGTAGTGIYRIFRSAATYSGNLGGIAGAAGADNKCDTDTNKPPNTGIYKALLVDGTTRRACLTPNCSDPTENVDWVLKSNTTYYRSDGVTEVSKTNCGGVFSFPLTNSVATSPGAYFTGLLPDWTTGTICAANWTSATGNANYGQGDYTTNGAIGLAASSVCTSPTMYIVCVEQ